MRAQLRRLSARALAALLFVAPSAHASPEETARAALARADASTRVADLVPSETIALPGGEIIVRFDQRWRGLPVLDHGAAVRLDAAGRVVVSRARVTSDLPASVTPRISREAAAARASLLLRFGDVDPARDVSLVVASPLGHAMGRAPRLAWAVTPRLPIPSAPLFLIDADDGHVLQARERAVSEHRATVFVDNPVRTPVTSTQDLPIDTTSDHLESAEVKSLNCVDTGATAHVSDGNGGKIDLRVCDLDASATSDGEGLFSAAPSDDPKNDARLEDPYSEVSMYFHVSRAFQFFRGLRGDEAAQVVNTKPLITVSNLRVVKGLEEGDFATATNPASPLVPFANAFFSPSGQGFGVFYGVSGGSMWFGQGPKRDYAYDGDVVYHEFTHGVVDKTLQLGQYTLDRYGLFDAPGAMNEGLADYFSSALAGDPEVGEYASADIADDGLPIRTLANDDTCPARILGEPHFDSTSFSGGLYAARTKLPEDQRSAYDAALYASMLAHPHQSDLGYADLIGLFLDTLAQTLPAGHDLLKAEMEDRGLLPDCTRIVRLLGDDLAAPVDRYGDYGYSSPGLLNVGQDQVEAPGVIQVEVPLDGEARHMALHFIGRDAPKGLGSPQGTPFRPAVLVKLGKPITWSLTKQGDLKHDADVDVEPTSVNGGYEAIFDVPAGTTLVYAQIVNKGESDGLYDHIDAGAPNPVPTPTPPPKAPPPADDSGCSCHVGAVPTSIPWSFAPPAGALAILVARRRRRHARPGARTC